MRIEMIDKQFRLDGRPHLVLAGEIHYFRIPRPEWEQRLDLLVEAGANCLATYMPWVVHEQADGSIDLTGRVRPELDLGAFVDLAAERGLTVLARPGPFTMGELRHEGIPSRLRTDHPEILPVGWDGAPATTSTVDYLAPAFLAEVRRWYLEIGEILRPRSAASGGPVIAVQLDNEIGMLSWVSNTPDLTDRAVDAFRTRMLDTEATEQLAAAGYPVAQQDWTDAVRSPDERLVAALRVDLAEFLRESYATYVGILHGFVTEAGLGDLPQLINVHGTEAGSALSFPIGISQLQRSFRGRPGFTAGSDHYLGTLTWRGAAELHLVHAFLDAAQTPEQPLTSLEFEAGTGDYGGDLGNLTDPASVILKTRLLLSQGARMLNWYLFAGGTNVVDPRPDDNGTHRFGITGERHGHAAPVTPEGTRGPAFPSTVESIGVAANLAGFAAAWVPEHDDLAVGFVPDHWATEHRYPGSTLTAELVGELTWARGAGPRAALPRCLLAAGFRYGAVDLQDPQARLPRLVVLGTGRLLQQEIQERLLAHVHGGGRLLLLGDLPVRDLLDRPATAFADALGLRPGELVRGGPGRFPSVQPVGPLADLTEVPLGRLTPLQHDRGIPLLVEATTDRPCGLEIPYGDGFVTVIAADWAPAQDTLRRLVGRLGVAPGLVLTGALPGLYSATTRTPEGERFLHLINVEGHPQRVTVTLDGSPVRGSEEFVLAPRTGTVHVIG
ncbi:hypothetical protein GIS00_01645 [Nakamurella sp. YIM 132087]|uniref:Beta-galactosidase n=1 Tax=Nakamurella alba TaxID=2665158 RepID=A0A7K1FEX9_9ACTN|nr:beta-galactosidase [Nakamurella alba]MTD12648.1 hypothetical protein [Nakamurella alba]